ncbi:MAG TPA: hypothetical protein VK426_11580 [Methanobacterium sp.]|nr:hypothetical protein [Methanobacterium sp.]
MKENAVEIVKEIMRDFASFTGLEPESPTPTRYLWTDAFAVCNYLELFSQTEDKKYLDLALRLVHQVHHVLGKHRNDDPRSGWISGFDEKQGEEHPTIGGLRIGKKLNERKPEDPIDQRLEWDQDGQYYHYLTKWMHALNRVARVTEDPIYVKWAVELAQAAHEGFTYLPADRERKIMYWKMSIDLSYPLVPSMGQHDPLDGFVTYNELQITAEKFNQLEIPKLEKEISQMRDICRGMNWTTNDPLGIGGLLFDAGRIAQIIIKANIDYNNLLELILNSAIIGMNSFVKSNPLRVSPDYRLAFRELGLSIGLEGAKSLQKWHGNNENCFKKNTAVPEIIAALMNYSSLGDAIENFWIQSQNRQFGSWAEHREINMVMLATSLAPNSFLMI